jgi:cytochrome c oxidase subunit 3
MNGVVSDRMNLGPVVDQTHGPYPIGLMGLLSTVAMLFAAFTAAILVRRTGTDWIPVTLPPVVWINSLLIAASSVAVELARRSMRRGAVHDVFRTLAAAGALGALFLAGQVVAWRALAAQGVFLPSNPHAAFFYMLSAVHGLHVLGGLGALSHTLRRAVGGAYSPTSYEGLTHAAIFWHFVGGLWIYLLVLLSTL